MSAVEDDYPVSTLDAELNLYDDLMAPNSYTDILFNYYLAHTQFPLNDFFIIRSNQYEYILCSFNQNSTYAFVYFLNYTSGYDTSYIINSTFIPFSDLYNYIYFDKYFLSSTIFTDSDLEIRPSAYIKLMREDNIYLCYLFILILFIFYVFRIKFNPYKKVLS